jgi:uncharacterized phiE125 gp8 family phage protein
VEEAGRSVRWDWTLVTGPAQEPIDIGDAKAHARITHAREDALIDAYIVAARQAFERCTDRAAFTQTWRLSLACFADVIPLPMAAPLQNAPLASPSTAPVITYYDSTGTLQTLATSAYVVNTTSEPGQIERAPDQTWPEVQTDRRFPVSVTYVAGWSDVADIPELVKQGMRLFVTAMDMDRAGGSPDAAAARKAADALWSPYRVFCREPEWCR